MDLLTLLLSFLLLRSDDEVDQALRRFLQGFPTTEKKANTEADSGERRRYFYGIEVWCVVCYPLGIDISEPEGLVRLSENLGHKTNSKEMSLQPKASKCLVPDESRTIPVSLKTVLSLSTCPCSCSTSRDPTNRWNRLRMSCSQS